MKAFLKLIFWSPDDMIVPIEELSNIDECPYRSNDFGLDCARHISVLMICIWRVVEVFLVVAMIISVRHQLFIIFSILSLISMVFGVVCVYIGSMLVYPFLKFRLYLGL